jgi:hypothetical protein
MGEQGAGHVEKACLESGADINQVCGNHSALSVVHLLFSSLQGGRNGYRLVHTLGKSSKVSVLSTNIREVMDYEPTDITAVIKHVLLLNDTALHPPVLYAKRATSPLTSMSQGSKRHWLDRVDDPPFAVVIPLPPRRANSHMHLQTMSNTLLTTSEGQMRASSSQYGCPLYGRSTTHRPLTSSPPSQRALDALHYLLQLKRQIIRSSGLTGSSAVLPSLSCSLQMPYMPLKGPHPKCPSN